MKKNLIIFLILLLCSYIYFTSCMVEKMSNNNLVDNLDIYIVNLKIRTNRRLLIEKELCKHNLNGIFYNAVDGNKLDIKQLEYKKIIDISYNKKNNIVQLTRGEIGCSLSHYNIWKYLLESDKEYFLILEDDAVLVDNFKSKLNNLLNEVKNSKWDMIYLIENCKRLFNNCDGPLYTPNTKRPINIGYGTWGYLIKKEFVKKCIDYFPIIYPIDVYIKMKEKEYIFLRSNEMLIDNNKELKSDTINII